ncbi:MAG: hypothetical protein RL539_654, partial [Pseudomonadota bacterium]
LDLASHEVNGLGGLVGWEGQPR